MFGRAAAESRAARRLVARHVAVIVMVVTMVRCGGSNGAASTAPPPPPPPPSPPAIDVAPYNPTSAALTTTVVLKYRVTPSTSTCEGVTSDTGALVYTYQQRTRLQAVTADSLVAVIGNDFPSDTSVSVTLSCVNGSSPRTSQSFRLTLVSPVPVVSAVQTTRTADTQGVMYQIAITGTGFDMQTLCSFDGSILVAVDVYSSTSIGVPITGPANFTWSGNHSTTCTNPPPGGGSGTLAFVVK